MKHRKVLITGGAGFIGSHITDEMLRQGWEVLVLDNFSSTSKLSTTTQHQIQLIEGDVRDSKLVHRAVKGCHAIIHLAAVVGVDEVIKRDREMIETESIGVHNVLTAALEHGVDKMLYASSSAVYKEVYNGASQEKDDLGLVNTYAIAKRLNEKYLEAVAAQENINTVALRFFNVYGNRQDSRMVIPRFFNQALNDLPIEVFGEGTQTRDFTHIADVKKAVSKLIAMENLNGIFNIAREVETSILDLATEIKRLTRSSSEVQQISFPNDRITFKVNRRIGSSKKLFTHTGIRPTIPLKEGLIKYYKSLVAHSKPLTQQSSNG